MTAPPVIRVEHVAKSYGPVTVIDDLSLDIKKGEFLTLLGPSGCGKTTTLRMIAGFETPDRGRILLNGEDVSDLPPYKRPLNTVFQNYALFPHMTVRENVAFGPKTAHVAASEITKRVDAALAMINMSEHAHKRPTMLSGGQQQRVALARALVNQPAALLLDEPLSALDVKLRRSLQIELKRIQSQIHTTFIFVTHDQEEALTMSSRIAVMNKGRIEQLDVPEVIYNRPATPFVASFIGHANLIPARVTAVADGVASLDLRGGGTIRAMCAADQPVGGQALLMVRPEQIDIRKSEDSGAHGFAARLGSIDFQGASFRYELIRPDGSRVIAAMQAHERPKGAATGDAVLASFAPAEAWVINATLPDTTTTEEISP